MKKDLLYHDDCKTQSKELDKLQVLNHESEWWIMNDTKLQGRKNSKVNRKGIESTDCGIVTIRQKEIARVG